MTRRALAGAAAWAVTAAGATGVGLAAISALGAGIIDRGVRPMTADQVEHELSRTTPGASPPGGTSAAPADGTTRALSTAGGTVLARCDHAGNAYLVSWTPAQGFGTDDERRGPAPRAWVEFESGGRLLTVQVTCRSNAPVATTVTGETDTG